MKISNLITKYLKEHSKEDLLKNLKEIQQLGLKGPTLEEFKLYVEENVKKSSKRS